MPITKQDVNKLFYIFDGRTDITWECGTCGKSTQNDTYLHNVLAYFGNRMKKSGRAWKLHQYGELVLLWQDCGIERSLQEIASDLKSPSAIALFTFLKEITNT